MKKKQSGSRNLYLLLLSFTVAPIINQTSHAISQSCSTIQVNGKIQKKCTKGNGKNCMSVVDGVISYECKTGNTPTVPKVVGNRPVNNSPIKPTGGGSQVGSPDWIKNILKSKLRSDVKSPKGKIASFQDALDEDVSNVADEEIKDILDDKDEDDLDDEDEDDLDDEDEDDLDDEGDNGGFNGIGSDIDIDSFLADLQAQISELMDSIDAMMKDLMSSIKDKTAGVGSQLQMKRQFNELRQLKSKSSLQKNKVKSEASQLTSFKKKFNNSKTTSTKRK